MRLVDHLQKKRDRRTDAGFVAIEFVAGIALLLLPVTLLMLTLPTWWERASMARVASREAARTYVLTHDPAQASAAVAEIGTHYDVDGSDLTLTSLTGDPTARGTQVVATVHTQVPAIQLPIFNVTVGNISLNETHTEPVDKYRSLS